MAIINLWSPVWMLIHTLRRRQRRIGPVLRWEGLSMRTIQYHSVRVSRSTPTPWRYRCVAKMRIGCVSGYESLSLRGHGCEHALLIEADTITATPIRGGIESGASNLSSPTISTGDGSSLPRGRGLIDMGWCGRRRCVDIWRALICSMGGRETVLFLMLMLYLRLYCGHIGAWRGIMVDRRGRPCLGAVRN